MMKKKIIGAVLAFFVLVSTGSIVIALNITPVTLKRETFVYEYGTMISTNPAYYVNANESIIKDVVLNLNEVKNEIGIYPASASYAGIVLPFYIKIQDTTKPVAKLKQVVFNVYPGEKISAFNLLEKVEDHSDIIAYFLVDGEKHDFLIFTEKGSYVENIVVEDAAGNQASKLRVKIVVGQMGNYPTLEGITNVEVVKGASFDPLKGVKASDGNGNDITNKIKILKNNVNVDEIGTYEVIYSVTNDQGNNIQRTRKVEVIKNESEKKR
ncbi:MAG: immunoglobulin-like domain-containing protein [Faecalibacillus sp.]